MSEKTHARPKRHILLKILAGLFFLIAIASVAAAIMVSTWLRDIPDCSDLSRYTETGVSTIYASDKETVLAEITYENRIEISADDITQDTKDALVAIEDERFYEHGALDPIGLARAVVSTVRGNKQGASTLTQQLARNTVLINEMSEQTLERKVREAYVAFELEKRYSKDEIIAAYLNVVNFSNANYGIEAAARDYFGISAKELSLAQAAALIGIPNAPSLYNPRTNLEGVLNRQKVVLSKMLELGFIDQEEYDEAVNEEIVIEDETESQDDVSDIAPYFVDYVKQLLNDDAKYNMKSAKGGNKIYTTLNVEDQQAAKTAIDDVMEGSDLDASLTSVDPENGYILSMIGGRDYAENNFNLSTQMSRQPGSTFKPFTLIAAMQMGIDPETRFDATAPAKISDTWTVRNAEGGGSGMMSLTTATTRSINTVYARLAHEIGSDVIIDTAHSMGIKSALTNDETITLGTSGVNTLEMASAYATLASGGIYHEPVAVTSIEDEDGNIIYELSDEDLEGTRVLSEAIAAKATEILQTVITSGTGRGAKLSNEQPAAGKTGTSEHGRDLWFVGYTPQISCAVWTGHRDETETSLYGGTTSTPIWKKYVDAVLENEEIENFPEVDEDSLLFTSSNALSFMFQDEDDEDE